MSSVLKIRLRRTLNLFSCSYVFELNIEINEIKRKNSIILKFMIKNLAKLLFLRTIHKAL